MNFDTGVMRFSSPSMGACAAAGPAGARRARRASASVIVIRIMRVSFGYSPSKSCVGLHPGARALHRPPPSRVGAVTSVRGHRGGEAPVEPPVRGEVGGLPQPHADTGEIRGAEAGG